MPRLTARFAPLAVVLLAVGRLWAAPATMVADERAETGRTLTVGVPMRDGTKLATDVYLPPGDGPWPAVLYRTPYGRVKQGGAQNTAGLNAAGLVVVIQDSRGRFDSEGANLPFLFDGWGEQQDGYDTIEWIAAQPWSNGKVGTSGGSAGGITQLLTAPAAPPHLVCQSIGVAFGDMYRYCVYPGGVFRKSLLEGWLKGHEFDPKMLAMCLDHESDDDFWRALRADEQAGRVTVPGSFSGGWYDVFSQGTVDAFVARQTRGGDGARGRQKLLMGPWPHGRRREVGELVFPENALRPPRGTAADAWAQHWLRGIDRGLDKTPAVTWYVMGACGEDGAPGNQWRTADAWPVPCTPTDWCLQPDGGLTPTPPPAGGQARSFRHDPANPVPTRGGNNLLLPAGPMDQRPIESRADVLTFSSAPLDEPLEITGRVTARLWVSSTAVDTDLMVRLTDVYPDGRSMLVLDGARRLRYRHGFTRPEPLTPGQAYEVEVDLWSTSLIVNRGHRLRVVISSSNYPRFEVSRNNGAPYRSDQPAVVATNTIYLDRDHPSRLVLPVVR